MPPRPGVKQGPAIKPGLRTYDPMFHWAWHQKAAKTLDVEVGGLPVNPEVGGACEWGTAPGESGRKEGLSSL